MQKLFKILIYKFHTINLRSFSIIPQSLKLLAYIIQRCKASNVVMVGWAGAGRAGSRKKYFVIRSHINLEKAPTLRSACNICSITMVVAAYVLCMHSLSRSPSTCSNNSVLLETSTNAHDLSLKSLEEQMFYLLLIMVKKYSPSSYYFLL